RRGSSRPIAASTRPASWNDGGSRSARAQPGPASWVVIAVDVATPWHTCRSWHSVHEMGWSCPLAQGTGRLDIDPVVCTQLGVGMFGLLVNAIKQPKQRSTGNWNSSDSTYWPPSVWPKILTFETSVTVGPPE